MSVPLQLTNPRRELRGHRSGLTSRSQPVFRLVPSRVELFPGSSSDMVLTGSSDNHRVSELDKEQELTGFPSPSTCCFFFVSPGGA